MSTINLAITKAGKQIQGSCSASGREGTIECFSVSHGISMPYDYEKAKVAHPSSHGSLTISKALDKSSPVLYQALLKSEPLDKVELTWRERSSQGKEEPIFTQTLEKARVVSIRPHASSGYCGEEVSIAYEKVAWTYVEGGISAHYSLKEQGNDPKSN